MKTLYLLVLLALIFCKLDTQGQNSAHDLIGYWQNWNDANAPYIQLDAIDDRYSIVEVSFVVPTSPSDMTMIFTPDVVSQATLIQQIQTLKTKERKCC
jgi:chitinase